MKMLLVIHEKDLNDTEQIVVGVADSVKNAEKIIRKYNGEQVLLAIFALCIAISVVIIGTIIAFSD